MLTVLLAGISWALTLKCRVNTTGQSPSLLPTVPPPAFRVTFCQQPVTDSRLLINLMHHENSLLCTLYRGQLKPEILKGATSRYF